MARPDGSLRKAGVHPVEHLAGAFQGGLVEIPKQRLLLPQEVDGGLVVVEVPIRDVVVPEVFGNPRRDSR